MLESVRYSHVSRTLAHLEGQHAWALSAHAVLQRGTWFTRDADARVDFPESVHDVLGDVEEDSLWFRARNQLIEAALRSTGLPDSFWDIGAGGGVVSGYLAARGTDVIAVEPTVDGARRAAKRHGVTAVCGTLESLCLPAGSVEAAGMFDVIEHLSDPKPLLAEAHRVLMPGGRLVVTVPALPALWSQADEFAGHHRRYTTRSLDAELGASGFSAVRRGYRFASAVVPLFLQRTRPYQLGQRLSDAEMLTGLERELGKKGSIVEAVGRAAMSLERLLASRELLPVGTSVLGVYAAQD